MPEMPDALNSVELEDVWRRQVENARTRYLEAVEQVKRLSEQSSPTDSPERGFDLVRAHRQEAAARREYTRVLEAFTQLVMQRNEASSVSGSLSQGAAKPRS